MTKAKNLRPGRAHQALRRGAGHLQGEAPWATIAIRPNRADAQEGEGFVQSPLGDFTFDTAST
jgi:hypothetical protein